MNKCPTCNSPSPERHPAVQHEGEVSLVDAFLKEALGRVTAYDDEPDEPVTRYELIALINVLQRQLVKGGV